MQFLNKNELVLVLWSLIPVLYLLLLRVTKLFVHLVDMLGGGVIFGDHRVCATQKSASENRQSPW